MLSCVVVAAPAFALFTQPGKKKKQGAKGVCEPKVWEILFLSFDQRWNMVVELKGKAARSVENLFMGGQMNSLGPPSSTVNECFRCPSRGRISDGSMKKEKRM
jgi:hypothetical protein